MTKAILQTLGRLGAEAWAPWHEMRRVAAVIGTVVSDCVQPRRWALPVRKEFVRQILAIGVEPLWIVGTVAVFVGISVVVQLRFWMGEAGQSQLVGPLLLTVVARELGPVLINLIIIVRSGSMIVTELGLLKINGGVATWTGPGADPFTHLVLPRVLAMAVSAFCLTIVFILAAFASGYLFSIWTGKGSDDLSLFADTIARAVQPEDIGNILAKSILPALFASVSCCLGGLDVGNSDAEIPQATQRALTRSVAGLFLIAAAVSLLTYL